MENIGNKQITVVSHCIDRSQWVLKVSFYMTDTYKMIKSLARGPNPLKVNLNATTIHIPMNQFEDWLITSGYEEDDYLPDRIESYLCEVFSLDMLMQLQEEWLKTIHKARSFKDDLEVLINEVYLMEDQIFGEFQALETFIENLENSIYWKHFKEEVIGSIKKILQQYEKHG